MFGTVPTSWITTESNVLRYHNEICRCHTIIVVVFQEHDEDTIIITCGVPYVKFVVNTVPPRARIGARPSVATSGVKNRPR